VLKRPADNDNLGLWLDKLGYRDAADGWSLKENFRLDELKRVCKPWSITAAMDAQARWEALPMLDAGSPQAPGTLVKTTFSLHTEGHLLVDYGRASASESSVSMHWTFGCPRIPGSALKGLARQHLSPVFAERACGRAFDRDGSGHSGAVTFLDALPARGQFTLAPDVLTPHFGDYYQVNLNGEPGSREQPKLVPPADWLSPVPFTFLTVVDTSFAFILLARQRDHEALTAAAETLREALLEWGVGAKTSAGYGGFRPL